jgi:hypothetical protein
MAGLGPSFSYLNEFGVGGPTPPASRALRLPDNTDLQPPIPHAALWDATGPAVNQKILSADPGGTGGEFLQDHYARVTHHTLDGSDNSLSEIKLHAWKACHNGLRRARRCRWLEEEDIYHLTERLVTWIQDQSGARLGNRALRNWWIVPELYALRIHDIDPPGPSDPGPPGLADPEWFTELDQEVHKQRFNAAKLTAHLVVC